MKKLLYLIAAAALLVSCGTAKTLTRGEQYPGMYETKPVTLLVMPPINKTSYVPAKELLYTSISRPLAEAGYYVISPLLAMDVLKAESAYDAEPFIDAPLGTFHDYFGADAVVFSEIKSWTKQGFGIRTDIRYFIRSTASGEIIFDRSCNLYLDLSSNSSSSSSLLSVIVNLAVSAIETAATEHIVAARSANYYIFRDIPAGAYSPNYLKDADVVAEPKDVTATVK